MKKKFLALESMNPKLKAILISLLFIPLLLLGQYIGVLTNNYFFSYGEIFVVGIMGGLFTGEVIKIISKKNDNFWHFILLPIIFTIGPIIFLVFFAHNPLIFREYAMNITSLITYIFVIFLHNNKMKK